MLIQSAAVAVGTQAPSLATIISGATLAAVLWLFRSVQQLREDHVQFRTILTGANGDNGINGEVKALRTWRQELEEDRRHGEADRRHA